MYGTSVGTTVSRLLVISCKTPRLSLLLQNATVVQNNEQLIPSGSLYRRGTNWASDVRALEDQISTGRISLIQARAQLHSSQEGARRELLALSTARQLLPANSVARLETSQVWWSHPPNSADSSIPTIIVIPNYTDFSITGFSFEMKNTDCGSSSSASFFSVTLPVSLRSRSQAAVLVTLELPSDHPLVRRENRMVCGSIIDAVT